MTNYTFLQKLLFSFLVFALFHIAIWNIYTNKIFALSKNHYVGDLGRVTYQFDLLTKRKNEVSLPILHISKTNYSAQKIDVITIGDSFSNGAAGGLNSYYQDYLATKKNLNIMNIQMIGGHNFIETIVGLYNNGILKEIHPKAIIIETVQRVIPSFYSRELNFSFSPNINNITEILKDDIFTNPIPELKIINVINYKVPFYTLLSSVKENSVHNGYKFTLSKNLFSSNTPNKLITYKTDINNLSHFTPANIEYVNKNFNKLASLLKKLNIELYFMPAVDRYDLYYDYILNNKYLKNDFFDLIREMPKEYKFVDTKKILLPFLENGEKDIFYSDDTHWSYKASDIITSDEIFNSL